MQDKLLRRYLSTLTVAAALMLPAMPMADAGKDVFVRSKPHVNVGSRTGPIATSKKKTNSGAATAHPDFLWSPSRPTASGGDKGGWKVFRGGGLRLD